MVAALKQLSLGSLLLCFLNTACAGVLRVTDDAGNSIHLSQPATRVISLAPHLTELVFSIGAGESLVGSVAHSDFPEAAKQVRQVGAFNALDTELILALEPDLVIAWQTGGTASTVEKLRELGISVYLSEPRALEDVAKNLRQLGRLLGKERQAQMESEKFLSRLQALRKQYQVQQPVTVFYQIWHEPLMTVNGEHIISHVIELCGGRNIFADLPVLAPRIGLESVLARNPQVIVAGGVAAARPDWKDDWQKWTQVDAVKHDNLFYVNPDLLQRHTPRILQGAKILCQQMQQVKKN